MRPAEKFWEGICRGRGLLWGFLLYPLSLAYGLISQLLRLGKPSAVPGLKVISIGNLSMGGSGKTPLVVEVCRLIARENPAILSRGYKGGDEAAMYRGMMPDCGIFLGASRLESARAAAKAGHRAVVLDDGFQRRHELERDLDILVLDWQRRDIEAHCLPAGRLREPLGCAAAADAVLVTHAPADWNIHALRSGLPAAYQGLQIFRGDHVATGLRNLAGKPFPLSWLKERSVLGMSGIGRPDAFESMLAALGALVTPFRFGDHHAYTGEEVPPVVPVITTAKDAVKLAGFRLPNVYVLEMRMQISPYNDFKSLVLK